MKKIVALISGLALAGCVNSSYNSDEIQIVDEPTGSVVPLEMVEQTASAVQPVAMAEPVIAQPAPAPVMQQPVISYQEPNVIEIPAQKIYITEDGVVSQQPPVPAAQPAPVAMPQPAPMPVAQPAPVPAPQPMPVYQPQEAIITLQSQTYPGQYMQCSSFDNACLNAALAQGYMPLQYAPQFAGFQSVLGPTDYPAGGRWWNSNNIPRW